MNKAQLLFDQFLKNNEDELRLNWSTIKHIQLRKVIKEAERDIITPDFSGAIASILRCKSSKLS